MAGRANAASAPAGNEAANYSGEGLKSGYVCLISQLSSPFEAFSRQYDFSI
ncbi:MAG: hypothetical protein OXE85_04305 [Roseovarius sp.]|nr:hypothetical protein [Roseovarius sp.]